MQVVVQTDYQDIYRVTDGVLLVVNKFEYDYSYGEHCFLYNTKDKPYNKLTQNFRILKEDAEYKVYNSNKRDFERVSIIPKGTVILHTFPVKPTSDQTKWAYEIKTTGNSFRGDYKEIVKLIDRIKERINEYQN